MDSDASDEERVSRAMGRVRIAYFEKHTVIEDQKLAIETEGRVEGYITRQVERQFKSVMGIDPLPTRARRAQAEVFVQENVSLIRSIGEEFFDKIEADVLGAYAQGARHEQLAKIIGKEYEVSGRRAQLIARDQIGSLSAKLNQAKQQELGVRKYIWRNSQDERVVGNPSGKYPDGNEVHGNHWDREGKVFEWGNPPHDGHPGIPIQCRCTAEPVWEDMLEYDAEEAGEEDLVFGAATTAVAGAARSVAAARHAEKRAFDHDPIRNRQGELTDGVYRVSPQKSKQHTKGHAKPGRSVFNDDVDPETIALEAAKIADDQGLWKFDVGGQAVVDVGRTVSIDLETGTPTHHVVVHRNKKGAIHAHPAIPPDELEKRRNEHD
ncbi:MAG: minor capsid protein [Bradymonadaceae bacterium]